MKAFKLGKIAEKDEKEDLENYDDKVFFPPSHSAILIFQNLATFGKESFKMYVGLSMQVTISTDALRLSLTWSLINTSYK